MFIIENVEDLNCKIKKETYYTHNILTRFIPHAL